tara:strand:+ start:39033 stop:39968 length:936 start_codon:yes stop_codon:yes gene_type:complete
MSISTNQMLAVYVSTRSEASGTSDAGTAGTAAATIYAGTSLVSYQAANGLFYNTPELAFAGAIDGTPANDTGDGNCTLLFIDEAGSKYTRRIEKASLVSYKETPYNAQVQKASTLTITSSITEGASYTVRLALPNYGGAISQQDEKYFYGNHVATSTDTATTIAAGLVSTINKSMSQSNDLNPFITVASAAGVITFTGVKQKYVRAKFQGKQIEFNASITNPEAFWGDEAITVLPVVGSGVDNQVRTLEEFFAGYNSDYANRGADFPGGGDPIFTAANGKTYDGTSILLKNGYGAANIGTQRSEILCYFAQ